MKYNFVELSSLEKLERDNTCGRCFAICVGFSFTSNPSLLDVIGIVKEVGPLGEITSKATNRTVSYMIHLPITWGFYFG